MKPTAYLYIGVHGLVMESRYRSRAFTSEISTTNILNNYDYLYLDPAKMHVEKVTVSPPGTLGLSSPYIFNFISDLLLRFPGYAYDSKSFDALLNEYLYTPETIKHRTDMTSEIRSHDNVNLEKEASETACSNTFAFYEPLHLKDGKSNIFINKGYSVNKTTPSQFEILLFVFMPDSGSFKTFNILSLDFLSKVCPYLLGTIFKDNKIVTINGYKNIFGIPQSNYKVLETITLDQIFKVLYWIGITNLYIIDPSCSVVGTPRCNRAACLDFQQSGLDISAIDTKGRSTAVTLIVPEDVFPQLRTASSSASSSASLDSSSLGGRSRKRKRRVKVKGRSRNKNVEVKGRSRNLWVL